MISIPRTVLVILANLSACLWLPRVCVAQVVPRAQEQDSRVASSSPLYPPQGVTVEFRCKIASITWQPILLDRLANYEVYRWNGDGQEHWEKIGETEKPEFVDKKPVSKKAKYKVTAVDRAGNKSALSQSKMSVVVDSKQRSSRRAEGISGAAIAPRLMANSELFFPLSVLARHFAASPVEPAGPSILGSRGVLPHECRALLPHGCCVLR